ncbi:hypothetical protein RBH29_02835 [Herbivorax sp. ANBcel31]|uniref:hypothetical protein n=1 Tax=Herbivorax sp. ANBcel31 TaxID=3069754 RepID=UPI0027B195ED|nr:hypothetical protein [Herbivorax sp. ANBcel31]MDQ2085374.1 hypothetical protein [Herbivorax sp. ANBcel31]
MLPLPNLDNQNYKEILEGMIKKIPRVSPQWTDQNYHDPGITLLQLFSWLKEMQQYYINQVGDKNNLKFLKLLGFAPRKTVPATSDVFFRNIVKDTVLPKGTKLQANDVVFEILDTVNLVDNKIKKIISENNSDKVDISNVTYSNQSLGFIFGKTPKTGSKLYIAFEKPLKVKSKISMFVDIYNNYFVKRNTIDDCAFTPLALLKWEYFTKDGWKPLKIIKDETYSFLNTGYMLFFPEQEMAKDKADDENFYWIRCTLEKNNYDVAPRIKSLNLNAYKTVQQNTLSEVLTFNGNGGSRQVYSIDSYLSLYGSIDIQVWDDKGFWRFWDDKKGTSGQHLLKNVYCIETKENVKQLIFDKSFCENVPDKGSSNIRVILRDDNLLTNKILGGSTGYPDQEFEIGAKSIMEKNLMLQVGKVSDNGEMVWEDWERTDDLDSSKANAKHYILNSKEGKIMFGNNEKGSIPPSGTDNILIISCSTCQGSKGNVKKGEINSFYAEEFLENRAFLNINLSNGDHALNGTDKETIEDAIERFRKDLGSSGRAITLEDYEDIVMNTPGLMIQKAKAIANFKSSHSYEAAGEASNCIGLVVKPFSEYERPCLSDIYIKNIKKQVDKYRLITTEVRIMSPEYIGIEVYGEIASKSHYKNAMRDIKSVIFKFFGVSDNGDNRGWEFGSTVQYAEIYEIIEGQECVDYIVSLTLNAQGKGVERNINGDIIIPPNGLVYLKSYDVFVKE